MSVLYPSNVTLDPSVTAVTATPALPALSLKAILKVTAPSVLICSVCRCPCVTTCVIVSN